MFVEKRHDRCPDYQETGLPSQLAGGPRIPARFDLKPKVTDEQWQARWAASRPALSG
jgi:hypothetical protein